uniref:Uncharacterized protein n=1 Tax=Spironucleus salmonicida TaxID=348837 RepID=V6LLC6_9EUKA|eukprot:EST45362.1 Hypothetical protein SS50377_14692 [Spironucleus salmonicida]
MQVQGSFGRVKKLSLVGIEDVCCWKLNDRLWDIRNRQKTCQGAGRMEVGFDTVRLCFLYRMIQDILLSVRVKVYQVSWQCSLVTRHDIKGIPFQNTILVSIQIYSIQMIFQYQLYIILKQHIVSLEQNEIQLIVELPKEQYPLRSE